MSATDPPGWSSQPRRAYGRCPACGADTEVTVVSQARTSRSGPKTLQSASVTLCNDHARELYAEINAAIEKRRA